MFYYDRIFSALGDIYCVFKETSLAGVSFRLPGYEKKACLEEIKTQFISYFAGTLKEFDLEFKFFSGTAFEREVWLSLRTIPYGEIRSYKWIAERIGRPNAVRAVGQALKKNPLPIVLPCHRVVASDGSIGGYSSGISIKRQLLDLEQFTGGMI